jgi:hypothetical protein
MSRTLKFAAAFLVLVILSAPLLAVTCIGGESARYCPQGCPMMASAGAGLDSQLVAQHPGSSCCEVSNGKPSFATELQVPVTSAFAAPLAVSGTPGYAPAAVFARRQLPDVVRAFESSQSLLCTFLI